MSSETRPDPLLLCTACHTNPICPCATGCTAQKAEVCTTCYSIKNTVARALKASSPFASKQIFEGFNFVVQQQAANRLTRETEE